MEPYKKGEAKMPGEVILWAVLLVFFIIAELASVQLVSVWFAVGSLVAMITSIIGIPFWAQVTVFLVVSTILLALTRPIARRLMKGKYTPTNAELDIGRTAIVIEKVAQTSGRVRLDGVDWIAVSADGSEISEGEKVTVVSINGTSLIVERQV